MGGLGLWESRQRRDGVAPQGFRAQQGERIGQGGRQGQAAQCLQQIRQRLPAPIRLAVEHGDQFPVDFCLLEGIPDQPAVVEVELQITAEVVVQGAGNPGHLDDRVFHGVEEHGTQQFVKPLVPLLVGHQPPLDHAVTHASPLAVGEQLLQGRHVQHAAPDEEVSELLPDGIAAEVFQVAVSPVEPSRPVVLFQHELALRLLLVEGSHQGRQEMADTKFRHSGSRGWSLSLHVPSQDASPETAR